MANQRRLVVLMGPSGCGKSTLAKALAEKAGGKMLEADHFHSPASIAKMAAGTPLTDADRAQWVADIRSSVERSTSGTVWLACSALTSFVQTQLRHIKSRSLTFVLLQVASSELKARMDKRNDHFMPVSLLQSQLDALETPKDAFIVDANHGVEQLVQRVLAKLDK